MSAEELLRVALMVPKAQKVLVDMKTKEVFDFYCERCEDYHDESEHEGAGDFSGASFDEWGGR